MNTSGTGTPKCAEESKLVPYLSFHRFFQGFISVPARDSLLAD
jgi:hypothetical protein